MLFFNDLCYHNTNYFAGGFMKSKKTNVIGCLLLIIGGVMIVTGVADGEHTDVFQKAIRICLECIGIG